MENNGNDGPPVLSPGPSWNFDDLIGPSDKFATSTHIGDVVAKRPVDGADFSSDDYLVYSIGEAEHDIDQGTNRCKIAVTSRRFGY